MTVFSGRTEVRCDLKQTHPTTITLAAHARRGLIKLLERQEKRGQYYICSKTEIMACINNCEQAKEDLYGFHRPSPHKIHMAATIFDNESVLHSLYKPVAQIILKGK